MYFSQKNSLHIVAAIFLLTLTGCSHRPPVNLSTAKERVEKYHSSGEYDKDLDKIVKKAVKHFDKVSASNKATVVFDIDDTLLSCYKSDKSISFGYIPELSHKMMLEANLPAIRQTKYLYDYLVSRGFHIVLLTGRKCTEYDATIKNLTAQGFTHFDKLIVREEHERKLPAQVYKTARRKQLVDQGYKIVGDVGDQWSDLKGGYSGHKIKLPNYRYIIP